MKEIILIAEVIVPVFLLMIVGYFVKSSHTVSDSGAMEINRFVFKYLLPTNLFINIYNSNLNEVFNAKLILFCFIGALSIFFITDYIMSHFIKNKKEVSVMIHAIYRTNFVILGVVIIGGIYPNSVGLASVVSAFIIPLYNVLAVYLLEKHQNKSGGYKSVVLGIIHNPLIIACLLGGIFNLIGLIIPTIPLMVLTELSKCSTPIALLGIGMNFNFFSVKKNIKNTLLVLSVRLVLIPIIMTLFAVLFGFRNEELLTILILFGTPAAVSTYTMALQYDVNHELANLLVVMITLGCLITLYILLLGVSLTPFLSFV